jgi:hypothetical protein
LIVGCDDYQGHIYTATVKELICDTEIGWSVIGTGYYPAAREFTIPRYDKHAPFQKALFTAYRAKKSAETASFVGKKTDIIQITKGGYNHINTAVMDTLDRADRIYTDVESKGRLQAMQEIRAALVPTEQLKEQPTNQGGFSQGFQDRQAK